MLEDASQAADRFQLRFVAGERRAGIFDLHDRDEAIGGKRILGHLAVTRLEDVEWQDRVGE